MLTFAEEPIEELHPSASLVSANQAESQRLEPKDEANIYCDKEGSVPIEICSAKTPAAILPHHRPTPDQIGEEIDRQLCIIFGESMDTDTGTFVFDEKGKSDLESILWEIQRYEPHPMLPERSTQPSRQLVVR